MSYLANLAVKKISFVRSAANKRTFTLLKADEITGSSATGDSGKEKEDEEKEEETEQGAAKTNNEGNMKKGDTEMPPEVQSDEKKASAEGEVNKEPVADANINNNNNDVQKEDSEAMEKAELLKQNQELVARIEKMEAVEKKRETVSWLKAECPFLPDNVDSVADELIKLEKISETAAAAFRESLKKSSAIVSQSKVFKESGVTTDALLKAESDGFDLVRKVSADYNTLRKSDTQISPATIASIIRSHGSDYAEYRDAHIARAKRGA